MEKFKSEVEKFLLNINLENFEDSYWLKVVEGIKLLFKYKGDFESNQIYLEEYLQVRNSVLSQTDNRYVEEISDELWSVLNHAYPMPDFWNSTLEDFKNHVNFKKYFQMLNETQ